MGIPGQQRTDLIVKQKTTELAEFYLQMGLNRRTDELSKINDEEKKQTKLNLANREREKRQEKRMLLVGNKTAQIQLLEKKDGGDFGSGARGKHPSVILDRAKKKLLNEMSLETKNSPVRPLGSVSADLIDPSKSPFARGINKKDIVELRGKIPARPGGANGGGEFLA